MGAADPLHRVASPTEAQLRPTREVLGAPESVRLSQPAERLRRLQRVGFRLDHVAPRASQLDPGAQQPRLGLPPGETRSLQHGHRLAAGDGRAIERVLDEVSLSQLHQRRRLQSAIADLAGKERRFLIVPARLLDVASEPRQIAESEPRGCLSPRVASLRKNPPGLLQVPGGRVVVSERDLDRSQPVEACGHRLPPPQAPRDP